MVNELFINVIFNIVYLIYKMIKPANAGLCNTENVYRTHNNNFYYVF